MSTTTKIKLLDELVGNSIGTIAGCDCGTGSEGCSFRSGGRIVCHCEEGYVQRTVTNWMGEEFNTCTWCDCGDNGRCRYENDKKTCDCDEGYQEIRGECRKCDCGINSWCSFNGYEEKVCHCYEGYSDQDGTCTECDCDPYNMKGLGSTCYFDYGYKTCQCPKGFEPIDGTCEALSKRKETQAKACLDYRALEPDIKYWKPCPQTSGLGTL
ncbi:hypothetical protein CEXT_346451 [Caerostris extrusa]|uniref:EGF-like domain-containing protein n=1 Tax=Caerostris extrusa TaxID=172846 RepID=A0AAV4XXY2_CAEEX|nr:hypothetical protein CEXT_346451 [Caerostris extrusa]